MKLDQPAFSKSANTLNINIFHQGNVDRPKLSSQLAVDLQEDLLRDAAKFLRLRDRAHVDRLKRGSRVAEIQLPHNTSLDTIYNVHALLNTHGF